MARKVHDRTSVLRGRSETRGRKMSEDRTSEVLRGRSETRGSGVRLVSSVPFCSFFLKFLNLCFAQGAGAPCSTWKKKVWRRSEKWSPFFVNRCRSLSSKSDLVHLLRYYLMAHHIDIISISYRCRIEIISISYRYRYRIDIASINPMDTMI